MTPPVTQVQLENGLTIHLKEIHTAPIISHWVWYQIGSRNEKPGRTGVSHWVEHMQFKGTAQYAPGELDRAISRLGGAWNAFTYLDWTAYYETLPADTIDLALRLEADRMQNSLFRPEDAESERTVILSEREGSENEPLFRLSEAIQRNSFDAHAYRNEVIGSVEDLKAMTRDDLYRHYRAHYHPANAHVTLAGDFETGAMLDRLRELYGPIPAGPAVDHQVAAEAPLTAERRVEVSGPGETTYVQISYRAPAGSHPDFFAFTILDSLLTGPTGLNMFGGGGVSNKTSRLYRALVEAEKAVSVYGGLSATIDPYLYDINFTVHPDQTPPAALQVVDDEIRRLQDSLVSMDEIRRATKQARALFAYGSENITNQAFWLGYAEMFARYEWFLQYMSELEKITPADVQRAAQLYLNPSRRVVGVYLPTGENGEVE